MHYHHHEHAHFGVLLLLIVVTVLTGVGTFTYRKRIHQLFSGLCIIYRLLFRLPIPTCSDSTHFFRRKSRKRNKLGSLDKWVWVDQTAESPIHQFIMIITCKIHQLFFFSLHFLSSKLDQLKNNYDDNNLLVNYTGSRFFKICLQIGLK